MHAPLRTRRARVAFAVALAAVAVLRLACLDADPPASMPDPTVMDEGLWADSARGHLWFVEDWFADDLGNAWLVAPGYTRALAAVYGLFGIGLWQTRLLSALAGVATAALAGALAARRHGTAAGAVAVALVGLCPLLDQHARFALLESTQGCLLLLSFALLFCVRRSVPAALGAGAAMGCAMLVKPNAATFGVLPFAVALAWEYGLALRARDRAALGTLHRTAFACVGGGAAVLAAFGLPVWLAHWHEFTATLEHESGGANWHLGDHLLRIGVFGAREQYPGHLRLWAPLRHAPLCTLGLWLVLLRRSQGHALPDWVHARPLWIWLAIAAVVHETSYDHVARRQVLLLPAVAILCAQAFARRGDAAALRPWPRHATWLLLAIVPALLAKPALANALAAPLLALGVPHGDGTPGLLGGWIVQVAAVLVPLALGALRLEPAVCVRLTTRLLPAALVAAALFEGANLGALPPHDYTMRLAQERFSARVRATLAEPTPPTSPRAGAPVAIGDHAATLLQGVPVRTVRRVIEGVQYSSPRPNPDVVERLRPEWVVDYTAPSLREFADVTADGFELVDEVGFLRETSGSHRFEVGLWHRR